MKLLVDRKYKKNTYVIGNLYVDGKYFSNTLEDRDRGLKQNDPLSVIKSKKIPNETAIPTGKYRITLDVVSPKYSAVAWYRKLCGGRMPRLLNVPGYEGILIHPGGSNGPLDTAGCVLVGKNSLKGRLTASRDTFEKLYKLLDAANKRHEIIEIEIK